MLQELLFGIIGGLGLFIFGIRIMSDGLKKVAGEKMREILRYLTKNRFMGLFIGTVVTSVIQSSSATTVMVVGFVNAGLMTLVQAIPIVMGANIGTTITAQLVAFKLTDYALPIVGVGAFLFVFSKKRKNKLLGEAILGFGMIFLGLSILTSTVKVLGQGSAIHSAFSYFGANPFLAIIVGMLATEIVQSSSVTTGIVVVMAGAGLLDLRAALPLIFGINIGTTITSLIASMGTTITAKRSAWAHIMFNIVGTIIAMFMLPLYLKIVPLTASDLPRQVANAHTIFNIFNASLFIWFVPLYAKFIEKIIPGKEVIVEYGAKYLDKNLLSTPSIAIDASRKEIMRMMGFAKEMYSTSMEAFRTDNRKDIDRVLAREDLVDELRDSVTSYLVKITEREITEKEAKMIPSLLHTANDIERIADHAENMAHLVERKIDNGLKMSKEAKEDIDQMDKIVNNMIEEIIKSLTELDKKMTKHILSLENNLNREFIDSRERYTKRANGKKHNSRAGIIFVDMSSNFEKIGDHIANIAQAIEGKLQWHEDDVF